MLYADMLNYLSHTLPARTSAWPMCDEARADPARRRRPRPDGPAAASIYADTSDSQARHSLLLGQGRRGRERSRREVYEIAEKVLAQRPGDLRSMANRALAADLLGRLAIRRTTMRRAADYAAKSAGGGRELRALQPVRSQFLGLLDPRQGPGGGGPARAGPDRDAHRRLRRRSRSSRTRATPSSLLPLLWNTLGRSWRDIEAARQAIGRELAREQPWRRVEEAAAVEPARRCRWTTTGDPLQLGRVDLRQAQLEVAFDRAAHDGRVRLAQVDVSGPAQVTSGTAEACIGQCPRNVLRNALITRPARPCASGATAKRKPLRASAPRCRRTRFRISIRRTSGRARRSRSRTPLPARAALTKRARSPSARAVALPGRAARRAHGACRSPARLCLRAVRRRAGAAATTRRRAAGRCARGGGAGTGSRSAAAKRAGSCARPGAARLDRATARPAEPSGVRPLALPRAPRDPRAPATRKPSLSWPVSMCRNSFGPCAFEFGPSTPVIRNCVPGNFSPSMPMNGMLPPVPMYIESLPKNARDARCIDCLEPRRKRRRVPAGHRGFDAEADLGAVRRILLERALERRRGDLRVHRRRQPERQLEARVGPQDVAGAAEGRDALGARHAQRGPPRAVEQQFQRVVRHRPHAGHERECGRRRSDRAPSPRPRPARGGRPGSACSVRRPGWRRSACPRRAPAVRAARACSTARCRSPCRSARLRCSTSTRSVPIRLPRSDVVHHSWS